MNILVERMQHGFRIVFAILMGSGLGSPSPWERFQSTNTMETRSKLEQIITDLVESGLFDTVIYVAGSEGKEMIAEFSSYNNGNSSVPSIILDFDLIPNAIMAERDAILRGTCPKQYEHVSKKPEVNILEGLLNVHSKDNKVPLYVIIPNKYSEYYAGELQIQIKNFHPKSIGVIFSLIHLNYIENTWLFRRNSDIFGFDPADSAEHYNVFAKQKYASEIDEFHIEKVNTWHPISGFKFPIQLPISFNDDFYYNEKIVIFTELNPANIWESPDIQGETIEETCRKNYGGPLYEDLLMLSKMLKFNLLINDEYEKSGQGHFDPNFRRIRLPDAASKDMTRLIKGEADIVGGETLASYEVFQYVDISASTFYQSGAKIVSVEPMKTLQWYAMFLPYKWHTWMGILGTVPIYGILLYIFRKFSKGPDKDASFGDALWDITAVICWDSAKIPQPPLCIIILLSSYMITMLLVVTDYLGSFTSFVVTPSYQREPIKTMDQFLKSDMKWVGGRMTKYYLDYFTDDNTMEVKLVGIKADDAEVKRALEKLLAFPEENVYFERQSLIEWSLCHDPIKLDGRKLFFSEENIGGYFAFLYFRKGWPYTEAFNRKILILQDMHIIQQNHHRFIIENDSRKCHLQEEESHELIKLRHFTSGALIMGIGYSLALILFVIEIKLNLQGKMVLNRLNRKIRTIF